MAFSPDTLLPLLRRYPDSQRLILAYSGGADSHVLLHALAQLAPSLEIELLALHVDHGLQVHSAAWAQHCVETSTALGIPCQVLAVEVDRQAGEGIEAAARQARYGALAGAMHPGDLLLTAHHQDDQAETLLLQLLRGAGPKGLAAMATAMVFSYGHLLRPLLGSSRAELQAYATLAGIEWVDDPSNRDIAFDRNYLRHQVLPLLQARWPSLGQTLGRAARHQAEAAELQADLAELDMAGHLLDGSLALQALHGLSAIRCKNLLRHWISTQDYAAPDEARLLSILRDLNPAAADASPVVAWHGVELRRYQQRLYLMSSLAAASPDRILAWDGLPLTLADSGLRLQTQGVSGAGLRETLFSGHRLEIRFRRGGESCRPVGRGHSKSLKQLLQEARVLPWLRDRLPLIYVDGELAAVAGVCVCEGFAAGSGEAGREIHYDRRINAPDG